MTWRGKPDRPWRWAALDIAEERVRSLEATRDDLANELVAASRVIDEVGMITLNPSPFTLNPKP